MAAETAAIAHAGRQRRVRIRRVVIDMAGEAPAAPVPRHVERVASLRLAEMTACTLLAQHRVRNAMAQRLEVRRAAGCRGFVESGACLMNDAVTRLHQVARDARDPVGMTTATGAFCVREVARERDKALVRRLFDTRFRVARVAERAVLRSEGMNRVETVAFRGMTFCTAIAGIHRTGHRGNDEKGEHEREALQHRTGTLAKRRVRFRVCRGDKL